MGKKHCMISIFSWFSELHPMGESNVLLTKKTPGQSAQWKLIIISHFMCKWPCSKNRLPRMVVPFDYTKCSSESKVDPDQHTPLLLGSAFYNTAVYMGICLSHPSRQNGLQWWDCGVHTVLVPSQYLA